MASFWLTITEHPEQADWVDIQNNRSWIEVNAYMQSNGVSWNADACPLWFRINQNGKTGEWIKRSHSFTTSTSTQWLGSCGCWVNHKADGSASVTVEGQFYTDTSALGTMTTSKTVSLTSIPRATSPTIESWQYLGKPITVNLPRASNTFTHQVWYRLPGQNYVKVADRATTSCTFTIPVENAKYINRYEWDWADIFVQTDNNSTHVGDKTTRMQIWVPDNVIPSITSVEHNEAVMEVSKAFNQYVKGLSQLNITIKAVGIYGSEIISYETEVDGVRYIQQQFTSNVINTAGLVSIKVTVTDSRGRKASKTVNVSVSDYFKPQLNNINIQQCNSDGTFNNTGNATKLSFAGAVAPVGNANSKNLIVKWKKLTDSQYQSKSVLIDWTFDIFTIIPETIHDESYEFIVIVSDKLSSFEQKTENGRTALSFLAGGKGIRVFGEAEQEGFWINDIRVDAKRENITDDKGNKWEAIRYADGRLDLRSYFKITPVWDQGYANELLWPGHFVIKFPFLFFRDSIVSIAMNSTGNGHTVVADTYVDNVETEAVISQYFLYKGKGSPDLRVRMKIETNWK